MPGPLRGMASAGTAFCPKHNRCRREYNLAGAAGRFSPGTRRGGSVCPPPGGYGPDGPNAAHFAGIAHSLACKTGSPQLAGTLPDGTHYTNSVLIGYGPVQQPRFAVAVVIEYGAGGSNAAPVLRAAADWFAAAGMA